MISPPDLSGGLRDRGRLSASAVLRLQRVTSGLKGKGLRLKAKKTFTFYLLPFNYFKFQAVLRFWDNN